MLFQALCWLKTLKLYFDALKMIGFIENIIIIHFNNFEMSQGEKQTNINLKWQFFFFLKKVLHFLQEMTKILLEFSKHIKHEYFKHQIESMTIWLNARTIAMEADRNVVDKTKHN